MRRLRVCQLITTLGVAGAERGVYELSRRLDRARFDVHVVALQGGPVEEWLAAAGIPTTVLGLRGKWDIPRALRLAGVLRRVRPDILHTHLFHADLAGRPAAWAARVPHLVHTVWTAEGRYRPWQFAYARLMAKTCDRIVCVSESVREHHARLSGLPAWRYSVIPWGVDTDAFRPDPAARRRLRQEWGLTDRHILAAFIGRLESYKGVDVLLAAAERFLAAGPDRLRLVIAGDGPQRTLLQDFIAHAPAGRQVRWLGHVQDVQGVLSAADFLLMPSLWEGWPLALGEAMSVGLPAIGSDVPGIRDLIVPGQTGLLVPPGDPVALAAAALRLATDPELCGCWGPAGRIRIAGHFSLAATVTAHQRLYETVCGSHSPKAGYPGRP